MSSIGAVGAGHANWAAASEERAARMKERLFEKADADGSGKVDAEELKAVLAHAAGRSGQSLGDADDLLAQMDGDGDGSLGSDELDAGMRSLLQPPASTVAFAQRREDMGGPEGMHPPPPPGGPGLDGAEAISDDDTARLGEALSQLMQAVDTDGNSSLDESERLRLGEALSKALEQGVAERVQAAEAGAGAAAGLGQPTNDAQRITALIERLLAHYQTGAGTDGSEATGTGVDLSV
ncbi:EF-hand domain-containing protein [Pseudorhodoferax sp.]|uniref:EF-hand domain-containing protein n=1 Tax=Pseudorhodoferax sp. TaxID=1993553 RepID=UPI002DD64762|nr:EF-hand domain-containing protein [Pseudorhodoferax sp.]